MICPVSAYKYYIRANRIFRENNEFFDAGFRIFVKSPRACGRTDFSCGSSNFRSFFHPTNIQNPAWFVRRDRFRGPTHEQWWISRMITSRGGFACTERDRRTRMRTETVKNMISRYFCCVFFTTGRTIFFLAGCAEPRCGDFKEWNSKFQGNTSFSMSKGTPGPQIVVSG